MSPSTSAATRRRTAGAAPETRDRLIFAALELFWLHGYFTTSLADVCAKAGARPGSLYYFFPTKQALLEAALDLLASQIGPGLLDPAWQGVDDPIARIFALLGAYRTNLIDSDFTYGCPIGSLSLEWRDPPDEVRARLWANFTGWSAAVRACLVHAQAQGRLDVAIDLDALATFVLTVMEGAVMQARAARSVAPFDQSVAVLRDYFERLLVR